MFRTLIKVNGVGPRMALGILSGLDSASFARAVLGNDVKALTALPGVGKKTAERLIIEMRDKVDSFDVSGSGNPGTMIANHPGRRRVGVNRPWLQTTGGGPCYLSGH